MEMDAITAKTAALQHAAELSFSFLTNVNASELDDVVHALVKALSLCGHSAIELEESAKAVWDGAAGVGILLDD